MVDYFDPTHIIFHKNCYDGFGSALAIWQKWPDAKFMPMLHTDPVPDLPDTARVVIADFSWKRPQIEKLWKSVDKLVILDHHDSAEIELAGLHYAHFDLKHSGAALAWFWANPGEVILPPFFAYIEDRDLWRFNYPGSREVAAWLQSFPYDFQVWDKLTKLGGMQDAIIEGKGILRGKEQMVDQMAANYIKIPIGPHKDIPVANAACYFSEVAEALCKKFPEAPFACYYMDRKDGKMQWGMRTLKKDFDVSVVAKIYGGGGSAGAAGFTTQGIQALKAEIEQYQVQMAGVSTAAGGWAGKTPPVQGDYGWSVAFQDVLELRKKYEEALTKIDTLNDTLQSDAEHA